MRILVTGADGFLGRGLVNALAARNNRADKITLTDLGRSETCPDFMDFKPGDLGDPSFLDELTQSGFDLVFHLASIPGSRAEQDQALGHRVNLMAPLSLADRLAAGNAGTRFVFASSIAVYGDLASRTVNPDTPCHPQLTYGAHKLMTEILLSDMTRRGALSTISIRFPGIVARPQSESGHGSAFMSQLFHRIRANEPFECPVPAESTCWWMSRDAAVGTLLHAAGLAATEGCIIQPPALRATVAEVVEAAMRVAGRRPLVSYGRNDALQRIFGSMPHLDASQAFSRGFHADANVDTLAQAAFSGV
ncbi:hypothetical protein ASD54_19255 [Rhizobium sp. Root149]|uniref:NAD-dependent epimerase/dehydratase family protein n=1 Tax=Rhizobium sp. Root149 TaxID=1736473 RepID=UPI0007140B01|nr:NAD-dependent epimerase/dehydratase family protein [Rhizobium sp. Root149]KQZ48957.1 hypothetical protein ASD54_19255 [Rhizobium sp. Root149]